MDAKHVGDDVFSVTSTSKYDVDYLGESTKGDLNLKIDHLEAFGMNFVRLYCLKFLPLLVVIACFPISHSRH